MSWFERRQAAAQQEAQAPPPTPCVLDWPSDQRPAAKAGESSGAVSAADDAAYNAVQRAAMSAPDFDERACATRVLSCDSEKGAMPSLRAVARLGAGSCSCPCRSCRGVRGNHTARAGAVRSGGGHLRPPDAA